MTPANPAVLFLHGLGGSRTAWDTVLSELSDRWFCVAWDLPGYGRSEPIEPLSFAAIADAAARLLDLLTIDRVVVVGLSFGGQQAQHLALGHPDRVEALILADTRAVFGADGTDVEEWKRLRLDPLDRGVTPAMMAEAVIDAITAAGFDGSERERAIEAFGRIPSAGLRAAVECLPTHDTRDRLADIVAPTLVIVGELDTETPRAYSEFLADSIPDTRLMVLPGVGHLTPSEAPKAFAAAVRDFLQSLDGSADARRRDQWNGR
ncbi:MAG: alpha/beta hydrolase [Acidimicrobiales bacterium]